MAGMGTGKRILVVTLIVAQTALLTPVVQGETITLRPGKEIGAIMVDDARSGNLKPGDEVTFKIAEDVVYSGKVAIPAGTGGTLTVDSVKGNGMFGKPGAVAFGSGTIEVGLKKVPVEIQDPALGKGKGKLTKGLLFLVVGVLFVKGEEGGLAPGTPFTVVVKDTVILDVKD